MKKKLLAGIGLMVLIAVTLLGCGKNKAELQADFDTEREEALYNSSGSIELKDELSEKTVEGGAFEADKPQKLVYTCRMEIETLEYEKTVETFRELVKKYGGFIEKETETDSARNWYYSTYTKTGGTMTASITVRIPTENYNDFLAGMEGSGKVVSRSADVKNITKTYTETETTIKALTIQEERLLQMLKEAQGIQEMLDVEDRLTEVQTELAQYKNALESMDSMVNYSTVELTIREVVQYTPDKTPVPTETFGQRLKNTLKETGEVFTDFLEGALFFLIEALPFLLLFVGIPLVILILCLKKAKKKRLAAKESVIEEKAPEKEEPEKNDTNVSEE